MREFDFARALPPYDLDAFTGFGAERRHQMELQSELRPAAVGSRRQDDQRPGPSSAPRRTAARM